MADIRFGHNLIGEGGRILRIGIDRPEQERKANEGPWLVQFWAIDEPTQRIGGHFILLSPDDLREGLRNRMYVGRPERSGEPRLLVSGVGTSTITVQKHYPNTPGPARSVNATELTRWIRGILGCIEADDAGVIDLILLGRR